MTYLRAIDDHEGPFDEAWMRATFASAWRYSQWPTLWSNMMLQVPLPDPMQQLIGIAEQNPEVARTFVACFDSPERVVPMLTDPATLQALGVVLPGT